jgi:hypothetical protein
MGVPAPIGPRILSRQFGRRLDRCFSRKLIIPEFDSFVIEN